MNDTEMTKALEAQGFIVMVFYDRDKPYFLGCGSHGGSGTTWGRALGACKKCCKIGRWWKLGDGTILKDFKIPGGST